MRVLVVDEDETSCHLLAKVLWGKGMKVEWTTDSLIGSTLSLHHPYDLFILDVRMPLQVGTEFAAGLKKKLPAARIVLISSFADEALRQTAKSLGVSLLSKPFTLDRLLQVVAEVLDQ